MSKIWHFVCLLIRASLISPVTKKLQLLTQRGRFESSSSTVKKSVVLTYLRRPGYIADKSHQKIYSRFARNAKSGCKEIICLLTTNSVEPISFNITVYSVRNLCSSCYSEKKPTHSTSFAIMMYFSNPHNKTKHEPLST